MRTPTTIRRRLTTGALAIAAMAGALTACEQPPPPGPTSGPGDGAAAATAGASCWGIKRDYPSLPSGIYWLATPAMDRPAPFYCDMVTDGGGWVLLARGREGWLWTPAGQQSPATVRNITSGPDAFAPASLPAATIDGLINGASPAALGDGIRVERALNTTGTSFQQVRLYPRFTRWTWMWEGGHLLNKVVIGTTTYKGSNTRDTYAAAPGQTTNELAGQQGTNRLFTWTWGQNGNKAGFSYGSGGPAGSTSSTHHLWQARSNGYTLPFTRVWARPRLANTTTWPGIPAGGYPAAPKPTLLKERNELAPWGVTGLNRTGEQLVEPWSTNVLALEVGTDRVFVGGRFTGVQRGPGGTVTPQGSLAAFDLDGNWVSTFRPTIAGRVWDLALTGDGKLIVAGDFTSVNGAPNTQGLAALDPVTGAVLSGWRANVARVSATPMRVRTLAVRGTTIYAGGVFDQVTGGSATTPTTVSNAISLSTLDGSLGTWRPTPNGQVVDVALAANGSRVLMAGFFATVGGSTRQANFAVTRASDGAPVSSVAPWIPATGTPATARYQQAVAEVGDRLLVGGSEHSTQLWDSSRTTLLDAAITKPGGDTQVFAVAGDAVYVGCHCGGWLYEGSNDFTTPSGARRIEAINLVGRWDAATWTYRTDWFPGSLRGAFGEGIWAMDTDARGCLWVGGDLVRGAFSGNAATDYLGGFGRFCPQDTTVPTTPGGFSVTSSGTSRTVRWTASTDPGGGNPTYDVIRNGRVIATVSAATRSHTDPDGPKGSAYTVRAVDVRGNRSASPPPVTVG
jgi:trimeric autotransporter adhesin